MKVYVKNRPDGGVVRVACEKLLPEVEIDHARSVFAKFSVDRGMG